MSVFVFKIFVPIVIAYRNESTKVRDQVSKHNLRSGLINVVIDNALQH